MHEQGKNVVSIRPGATAPVPATATPSTSPTRLRPRGADLRVALFVNSVEMGGVEEHVRQIAAGLHGRGAMVTLICPESSAIDPLATAAERAGVLVSRLTLSSQLGLWRAVVRFVQVVRLLRQRRIQVMHIHLTGYRGGRWAVLAARVARTPAVICTIQIAPAHREGWTLRLERRLMSALIHRFIAVSQVTRRRLTSYLGLPARKTVVIPNAVELDRYNNAYKNKRYDIRSRFDIPDDALVIGSVARLSPQKGLTYLITAVPDILAEVPNLHVLLVGDGPLHEELEAQARALGVRDRVHFAGYQQDVPGYLSAMDIFVLPSLFEGLPLSILEAMAAGLPVIATAVDGTPEALPDGIAGRLIPPRDPSALARLVIELTNDPPMRAQMAEAGRIHARSFSEEVLLDRVSAVYHDVLWR